MAIKIKLLRASSLDELEKVIEDFTRKIQEEDIRVEVDLAGGITYADDVYVAPVRISAPHLRSFEGVE